MKLPNIILLSFIVAIFVLNMAHAVTVELVNRSTYNLNYKVQCRQPFAAGLGAEVKVFVPAGETRTLECFTPSPKPILLDENNNPVDMSKIRLTAAPTEGYDAKYIAENL